jgi:hypothetical protein
MDHRSLDRLDVGQDVLIREPLGLDSELAHGSFHDRPRSRAGFSPDQPESIEILGCRRRRGQALVITKRRISAGNQNHLVFNKFFQPQPAWTAAKALENSARNEGITWDATVRLAPK